MFTKTLSYRLYKSHVFLSPYSYTNAATFCAMTDHVNYQTTSQHQSITWASANVGVGMLRSQRKRTLRSTQILRSTYHGWYLNVKESTEGKGRRMAMSVNRHSVIIIVAPLCWRLKLWVENDKNGGVFFISFFSLPTTSRMWLLEFQEVKAPGSSRHSALRRW